MLDFLGEYIYILPYLGYILLLFLGVYFWMKYLRKSANLNRELDMVFLRIFIPKKESKQDKEESGEQFSSGQDFKEVVGLMSHLFDSLYSIYSGSFKNKFTGQDCLSFEYVVLDKKVNFFIVAPKGLAYLVEEQITGIYPDCFIEKVQDYNIFSEKSKVSCCYLHTGKDPFLPIRTYENLKSDPLNTITNAVSKVEEDEGIAIQIVITPKKDGWQKNGQKQAENILEGKKSSGSLSFLNPVKWLGFFFSVMTRGTEDAFSENQAQQSSARTTPIMEEKAKAIEQKANSIGFESVIRVISTSSSKIRSQQNLTNLKSSFQQFSAPHLNSFSSSSHHNNSRLITDFILRSPETTWLASKFWKPMILSPEELSSIWHLPSIRYNRSPNIAWQRFKVAPPPDEISKEGILIGYNHYRGIKTPIYVKHNDRFRHFYVIGQTGTGKSTILQTMLHQDFALGNGVAVIDPHGQLIEDLLPHIPRERADDIIYFNPADTDRPMGLNILEAENDDERDLIALDAMNIMIKLFDEETFGPRIQDYFRNGCLTLMADPDGGALTDIIRLFTDDVFEKYKVSKVKNPVVRSFWTNQMAKTGAREKAEMIPYFAAKFGAFITNTLMRNIVGQTKSAFDFLDCMQNHKILLINLSKGLVGDINSKLLGLILVNKIQVAALRRQRMPEEDRVPFFLYIDEFQNYITDSIESILSEARKYRLGITLAHQYIDQLIDDQGKEKIKKAVFGNIGTICCYKIGAQDAEFMAKEMEPVFSDQDLINLDAFKMAIKLSINTQPSRPFSMNVQIPWEPDWLAKYPKDIDACEIYKEISRLKYGRDREFVSREIERRIGAME